MQPDKPKPAKPSEPKPHKHRRGSHPELFVTVNVNSGNTGDHQEASTQSSTQRVETEQAQEGCAQGCWKGLLKAFKS